MLFRPQDDPKGRASAPSLFVILTGAKRSGRICLTSFARLLPFESDRGRSFNYGHALLDERLIKR
jgi:hypothetical protein